MLYEYNFLKQLWEFNKFWTDQIHKQQKTTGNSTVLFENELFIGACIRCHLNTE